MFFYLFNTYQKYLPIMCYTLCYKIMFKMKGTGMLLSYNKTMHACFLGSIVQAIINNFAPLLFLTFQHSYQIPLSQITLLVTFNFGLQLLADALAIPFIHKIGYRISMVVALLLCAAGLMLLSFLPDLFSKPFYGLLIAVSVYAVGGGLMEVLLSPIVEACPTDNKEKAMSILHSFYCWGHVGVVLLSTMFFYVAGIQNWKILCFIWSSLPLFTAFLFLKVPIATLIPAGETGLSLKKLAGVKMFWVLALLMVCAGASEQAVSQWASTLAEKGLGMTKSIGDLAGPMSFAIMMGIARLIYGKYGEHVKLEKCMIASSLLCIASFLTIALVPNPIIALLGCAMTGFSVGIMWPGTFSIAAATIKRGGVTMFALLALGGDLGCALGPSLVGGVSSYFDDNLKKGILVAVIFPTILFLGILWKMKVRPYRRR